MTTNRDKVIWITGASSGLGKALTLELNSNGSKLIISSRNMEQLLTVKRNCPNPENIAVLPLDLENYSTMSALVSKAMDIYGPIDILINNAGISQRSLILDTDLGVYQKLMEVNYMGTIALTKALLPHYVGRKQGQFVTVTSLMGKFSSPYRSGYCGAKHALHGFFDTLRMEHATDNIKVTMICPGFANTNIARNALTAKGASQKENDKATQNGMSPEKFAKKMLRAMQSDKFEAYIGKWEIMGVYMKRFFPKLLHRMVLKSQVR
ncbi:Putative oxidoreductase SadH [Arenibacter antarcticus]|uniref:SDR family oxidoreductase n=1 Tax=Arenibacter antarcticus TaxID=2040469 RepID=A0ABW5VEZ5_9FLAO|nr:SDR family oxidoreductase [Arenibacter sp. H213]MCM4168269.1 short chain dehydrogenase [Arenibacter sp. H213]